MVRIFVYEYLCAELAGQQAAGSLCAEGRAMLEAVLGDFARIPGARVQTLLGGDTSFCPPAVEVVRGGADAEAFRGLARRNDFTLLIAPEFDGILETRSQWVVAEGGRLLGCAPEAIRLTADKLALAEHWRRQGVPTPPTMSGSSAPLSECEFPVVCKPRFGAGSQATFLARSPAELEPLLSVAGPPSIVQPFVRGTPVSAALIVGPVNRVPLMPTSQDLSPDGRFQYRGGMLPLPDALAQRATRLAERAAASIEGLCGYVGVDMVLGDAPDGSGDVAIEINPRLTTSYVGLRRLAQSNLAEMMLAAVGGEPIPPPRWRPGSIRFSASGEVRPEP